MPPFDVGIMDVRCNMLMFSIICRSSCSHSSAVESLDIELNEEEEKEEEVDEDNDDDDDNDESDMSSLLLHSCSDSL